VTASAEFFAVGTEENEIYGVFVCWSAVVEEEIFA
jgi:hypothetical protein